MNENDVEETRLSTPPPPKPKPDVLKITSGISKWTAMRYLKVVEQGLPTGVPYQTRVP